MPTYITTDASGRVTASADWPFPGSTLCPCDVVRYPNGGLYRADALPPVYGNPGTSEQQIDGECPEGWVVMQSLRPTEDGQEYVAQQDGTWIIHTPTPEEIAEEEKAQAQAEAATILTASLYRSVVQTAAFSAPEFSLFAKAGLFDEWAVGETYAQGHRLAHKGVVYEIIQEVTALENQPPDAAGMLAVYRPLSVDPETGEEPDGSKERPYAFLYGMDVVKDRYYSYNGKLYLAKADMPACVWTPDTAGLWQWEEVQA